MRFGFHISIAGGFARVVERAQKKGCETIQFFSRNPRGWRYTPLAPEDVKVFRESLSRTGIHPIFAHMPYLPNLASPDKELFSRSVDALCTELERCEALGAPYLITHVGSRLDSTEEAAIERMSQGIELAFNRVRNRVMLLLENTAGGGTEIGYKFEQIARIIAGVSERGRVGVVLDTAHAFEAGYDLKTAKGLEETLEEFDRLIGLKRLHLLHLNDSKTPLGSRSDRHFHIGEGEIGLEGFHRIVNHPRLRDLPGIMETPRRTDLDDEKNMAQIRALVR